MISVNILAALWLVVSVVSQIDPGWTRNSQIDAGQSKPINFGVAPNDGKPPGFSFNYNQHFNKTDFSVIPRVVLGQLSFDFFSNSTNNHSLMGYNITMVSATRLNFTFRVDTMGVTIVGLHFIYFAVSPVFDNIYFMENYYIGFNSSLAVSNVSAGSVRSQTTTLAHPRGHVTDANFDSSEIVLQAWILSYQFIPNGIISISIAAAIVSQTSFELTVTVDSGFSLSQLGVTVILANTTKVLEYSYSSYVDLSVVSMVGGGDLTVDTTTITDFNTQYFYRNTLYGNTNTKIVVSAFTFFYYNFTSDGSSVQHASMLGERSRVCPANNSFYFYENKTCIPSCPQFYFSNTTFTFCKKCHYSCKNCSGPSDSSKCTLCQPASIRQFVNNSSCNCMEHYFDNETLLCVRCHQSCVNCSNQLSTGCISCNDTLNRELDNGSCVCKVGYRQVNSSICVFSPVCGDGILTVDQSCDDGNSADGDGCSSSCTIENGHTCTTNSSLSNVSVCYYSQQIVLQLVYVYKTPLQNQVELTVAVQASNCNSEFLKEYLQSSSALAFESSSGSSRRLAVSAITKSKASYDSGAETLQVVFTYDSTITMGTIQLKFQSSQNVSSSVSKYFLGTPQVVLGLASPSNKLLTTFLSQSDASQLTVISRLYLVLIVMSWLFVIIAIFFHQGVLALEAFLVLQISYQSLLQNQFIFEGWSGLILFGKYSYGYNLPAIISTPFDKLTTIGLTIPLLNTINITAGVIFLFTVVVSSIFLYETCNFYASKDKELDEIADKGSTAQITTTRTQQVIQSLELKFSLKKRIVNICLEFGLVFTFLTGKIVVMSLSLAIKQSNNVGSSLLPALVLLGCSLVFWLFYLLSYDLQFLKQLSFRRVLRNFEDPQGESNKNLSFSNILVKYHYFLMYLLLLVLALVNALSSIGTAFFMLVLLGSLVWAIGIFVNGTYLRTAHTVRACLNALFLMVMMILLLLQSLNVVDPSQNVVPSIIGLVVLSLNLIVSALIFTRIEYKRRCKRKVESKVQNVNDVIIKPHFQTEAPIQSLEIARGIQEEIVFDRNYFGGKEKQSESKGSEAQSRQYTKQKMVRDRRDQEQTKQRHWNVELDNSVEGLDRTHNNHKAQTIDFQTLQVEGKTKQELKGDRVQIKRRLSFQEL